MKSLLFLWACGLVLTGVAGCAPTTPPTARVALDCPGDQGDLKLSSISPDKKTCLYSTGRGDEVSLRLIPVSGSYTAALEPIETELQGEIEIGAKAADAATKPAVPVAKATSAAASEASKAAKQAADDALGDVKKAEEDGDAGPGRGDHAHIDLPGIHIDADDDKSNANIQVGGINVDAGENGATVRMSRDVRLRGEAFSPERRGFRATYILARDDLKDGWKSVGYEAAGPKAGPIVVAVFKAHEGSHHDVSDDVKRLVRKNAGV